MADDEQVGQATQATDEGEERVPLEEALVARLKAWFGRNSARLASGNGGEIAELTIRLKMPSGDDDGTLYLYADTEETVYSDDEGPVPGLKLG